VRFFVRHFWHLTLLAMLLPGSGRLPLEGAEAPPLCPATSAAVGPPPPGTQRALPPPASPAAQSVLTGGGSVRCLWVMWCSRATRVQLLSGGRPTRNAAAALNTGAVPDLQSRDRLDDCCVTSGAWRWRCSTSWEVFGGSGRGCRGHFQKPKLVPRALNCGEHQQRLCFLNLGGGLVQGWCCSFPGYYVAADRISIARVTGSSIVQPAWLLHDQPAPPSTQQTSAAMGAVAYGRCSACGHLSLSLFEEGLCGRRQVRELRTPTRTRAPRASRGGDIVRACAGSCAMCQCQLETTGYPFEEHAADGQWDI
jgi:hypothetical protein